GRDNNATRRRPRARPQGEKERGRAARLTLNERAEPVAEADAPFTQSRARRLIDHALQFSAVDRELRHLVAGVEPARLAPDLLAEAIGVEQLVGADADGVEPLEQPQLGKLLDRVRQRVDADAQLAHRLRLLVDLAADAAGV